MEIYAFILFFTLQYVLGTNGDKLQYLFHDHLNAIVYPWKYTGDVSVVSSPNCPSSAADHLKTYETHKICVSHSYNSLWNGQYQWKSYSKVNHSIYQHIGSNKLIYQITDSDNFAYYLNDYETNMIMTTRCIINNTNNTSDINIFDCNGKWENYYNDEWNIDTNIFTSACNDLCVFSSSYRSVFTWSQYNESRRTNIYRCKECWTDTYLYGYKDMAMDSYSWLIGADPNTGDAWNWCELDYILNDTNMYTFNPLDCSSNTSWESFNNTSANDADITLSECLETINYKYNTLTVFQERKICIDDASDSSWNGEYKWLYYDSFIYSSAYYNTHKNIYLYPEITPSGDIQYNIYVNQILKARCNVTNVLDIAYCIEEWEIYDNNQWNVDTNMIITGCQEICAYTTSKVHSLEIGGEYGLFEWIGYNKEYTTNIYSCVQCFLDVYLFGTVDYSTSYSASGWVYVTWWTSTQSDPKYVYDTAYDWCDFGWLRTSKYPSNIFDCAEMGDWDYDSKLWFKKCDETCVKLELMSSMYQSWDINGNYKNFAVGFDLNIDRPSLDDSLQIQYSCYLPGGVWDGLLEIDYDYDSPLIDIVYNLLSPSCNDALSIDIKFMMDSNSMNVFINNVYLFYDSDETLYFDKDINSSKLENDSVYVTKTIFTNEQYKDLHVEWSLITGLWDNTTLNVSIYCDQYAEYHMNQDCSDSNESCYIQSYNLPSECDFVSQIVIRFDLLSKSTVDDVYIDYVHLTHSHLSSYTFRVLSDLRYKYPHLYHDRLYSLSNWSSNGNVSIQPSSHCPSLIPLKKICIAYHDLWNGEYEWIYYDEYINGNIYRGDATSNTYLYELIEADNTYKYYLNEHQQNIIGLTRCEAANVTTIRDCNGKWEHYYDNTWHIDTNMTSISCTDICVSARGDLDIPDGTIFKWVGFGEVVRTNYYYNEEENAYLTGYIYPSGSGDIYVWAMAKDAFFIVGSGKAEDFDVLYFCPVTTPLDSNYVFNVDNCLDSETWYELDTLTIVEGLSLSVCTDNTQQLDIFQESQLCIESSNHDILNGIYKFVYYDSNLSASIYYNEQKDVYLEPNIDATGNYQYSIYGTQDADHSMIYAKCIQMNGSFDITQCIGKWEIYNNDIWSLDKNMISTECQDVCFVGHHQIYVNIFFKYIDAGAFVYSHFNTTLKSNVYYSTELDMYLYYALDEWTTTTMSYGWLIAAFLYATEEDQVFGACYVHQYNNIVSVDDCSSWSLNEAGDWSLKLMTAYKCNPKIAISCAKLESNSEIFQQYSIDPGYKNIAVGFDINLNLLSSDLFVVQYSCGSSDDYHELTTFNYNPTVSSRSLFLNVVYNLPSVTCDDVSLISLKFILNGINSIYLDNIYLYYNVDNKIYSNDMNGILDWIETPDTETAGYNSSVDCLSNEKCYALHVSSTENNFVSITKAITMAYLHKDFHLEWSLLTNTLSKDSRFAVNFQCDNNYFYVYDLCILKEYTFNDDCTDNSCNIQAYSLPSECDFSSEITLQFYLESSSITDEVYIDYVSLYHSNVSGDIAPLCRTESPTSAPTFAPTAAPTAPIYIDRTLTLKDILTVKNILIGISVLLFLIIVLVASCYKYNKYMVNKYTQEMTIKNAMVILLAIGDYDDDPEDADAELGYLSDLPLTEDIPNLYKLFGADNLNYTIYPTYREPKEAKTHWTQREIIGLLKAKAEQFHNEDIFDALVVAISCHGWKNHICTSDYKLINKVAIHRLFSTKYPESRVKPRVFLFDCCDGENERIAGHDEDSNSDGGKVGTGILKQFSKQYTLYGDDDEYKEATNFAVTDIDKNDENWVIGEKNPDHKLVEIHGANAGFQSKYNNNIGSYMLYEFVTKTLNDLNNESKKCIFQVFDEIQHDLAERGKQQIITIYNNKTRYIKFQKKVNEQTKSNDADIEMQGLKSNSSGRTYH